jgi:hypothetical protein
VAILQGRLLSAVFAFIAAAVIGLVFNSATLAVLLFPILFLLALWRTWKASSMRSVAAKGFVAIGLPLMAIPFALIIWIFHAAGDGLGRGMGYGGGVLVLALFVLVAVCLAVFVPLGALGTTIGAYLGLTGWLKSRQAKARTDGQAERSGSP